MGCKNEFRFLEKKRGGDFSLRRCVQTGLGAYVSPYPVGIGDVFLGGKAYGE
jgi:hypothetical protein